MNKTARLKKRLFISLMYLIFLTVGVYAIVITQITPTVSPLVTSNNSVEVSYNFSTDYLNNLTFSWDEENNSFMQGLERACNMNNDSDFGENSTQLYCWYPGGGINGTVTNATWNISVGRFDGGFEFDGVNEKSIIIPNYNTGKAILNETYSLWFHNKGSSSGTALQTLIMTVGVGETNSPLYIRFDNQAQTEIKIEAVVDNGTANVSYSTADSYVVVGGDYFVTGVSEYNGTYLNISLYINGVYQKSAGGPAVSYSYNRSNFVLGRQKTGFNRYANVSMDDLFIHSRALNAEEAMEFYKIEITKRNSTDWSFFANQTLSNLNSTFTTDIFNYYICSANATIELCSQENSITQIIPHHTLIANFSSTKSTIIKYFYGTNVHNFLRKGNLMDADNDGTKETESNSTFLREKFLESGNKLSRMDGSCGGYFNIFTNKDFEVFTNETVNVSSDYNVPGGGYASSQFGKAYVSRSTDAQSGIYSMNITPYTGDVSFRNHLYIFNDTLKNYSASFWIKGTGTIGYAFQIRQGSYPECGGGSILLNETWQRVQLSCMGNASWYAEARFVVNVNLGESILLDNWSFKEDGVEKEYHSYGDMTNVTDDLKFLYENDAKGLIILGSDSRLSNQSIPQCFSQTDMSPTCPSFNSTLNSQITNECLTMMTNNHEYDSVLVVSPINEPNEPTAFMPGMGYSTNIQKSVYLNQYYNDSKNAIKSYNSSIPVGGLSTHIPGTVNTILWQNWMDAFPNEDFFEFHTNGIAGTYTHDNIDTVLYPVIYGNCSTYGANCSWIIHSEYKSKNTSFVTPLNKSNWNLWEEQEAIILLKTLNYNSSMSMLPYEFTDMYWYGTHYPEYTYFFNTISQPGIDNTTEATYYPVWNTTKNFAKICQSEGSVKETYSPYAGLSIISCQKGTEYGMIVINSDPRSQNVTINLSESGGIINYPYNKISNLNTGESYEINNGVLELGIMDSYDILYLTYDIESPIITINSPITSIQENINPILFSITTDEEANCILNVDGSNYIMSKLGNSHTYSKSMSGSQEYLAIFTCTDIVGNIGINQTIFTYNQLGSGSTTTGETGITPNITNITYQVPENKGTINSIVEAINEKVEDLGNTINDALPIESELNGWEWIIIIGAIILGVGIIIFSVLKE